MIIRKIIKNKMEHESIFVFLLVLLLCIMLIFSAILFSTNAHRIQRNEVKTSLDAIAENTKNALVDNIEGNIQMLENLASLIGYSYPNEIDAQELVKREKSFFEQLEIVSAQSEFLRMQVVDSNYKASSVYSNGKVKQKSVKGNEIVTKALQGERGIAETVWDEELQDYTNQYAVPIYENGVQKSDNKIIGVLTGTHLTDNIRMLLNSNLKSNEKVHAHIVDNKGNFVVRNELYLLPKETRNIFETMTLGKENIEIMKTALANEEVFYVEAEANGQVYALNNVAIGINNWNIMCVVPINVLTSETIDWFRVQQFIFLLFFITLLLLLFYIYRMMRKKNKAMYELAYIDPITGTFNRDKFLKEVPKYIDSSKRDAIIVLSINNINQIKNLYGTQKFNVLLRQIGQVLKVSLNQNEIFALGRNERFLILTHCSTEEEVYKKMMPLLHRIRLIRILDNQGTQAICSMGVRFITHKDKKILEQRITEACMTLDSIKQWKDEILFFSSKIYEPEMLKSKIEDSMEDALKNHEFKVRLQPKIDLKTGELKSAEALVRWIKDDGTIIFPDQFIPIFEKNGFCVDLDFYMIEQVCIQLKEWKEKGYPVVPVSVNQCRLMLYEQNYVSRLCDILKRWSIDPSLIILEITEGLVIDDIEKSTKVLKELSDNGFHISMDDFGSGFSSLNSLKDLPIDEVKLDRVFLSTIDRENEEKRDLIMKNIIHLVKELKMKTVVEGIETIEQEQLVRSMGCDMGQGYYYDKPLSLEEFSNKYYN